MRAIKTKKIRAMKNPKSKKIVRKKQRNETTRSISEYFKNLLTL